VDKSSSDTAACKPKVLIVKMWAFGDILMATPLLRALKMHWPDSSVHWLVRDLYAPILADNPLIDRVIAFDSALWLRQFRHGNLAAYLRTSRTIRRELQSERYDIFINLTGEKWWSGWFMTAPVRIGLFPGRLAGPTVRLYTQAIERTRDPLLHNTRHYLLPAKALGIPGPFDERMVVGVSDADRRAVDEFIGSDSSYIPGRPTIVLHPGASQATKCWPAQMYASLADRLKGCNIAITGSAPERGQAERIAGLVQGGVMLAAGRLRGIGETAALIERAAVVVTGDTSVLHIASALGVPLVGIYGSTRPNDNAPLFGRSELLYDDSPACAPCYSSRCRLPAADQMICLRLVTVDRVLDALTRLEVLPGSAPAVSQAG
jgi:lipopolysaccharide heptosyltransferase II